MTKMRVLMLLENNDFSRDVRVRQEARSLVAAGFSVDVICPGQQAGMEKVRDNLRVWRYRSRFSGDGLKGYLLEYGYAMFMSLAISIRIAMRDGVDVIHAHNPPDTFVFIGLLFKLFGRKFVFDHHDLSPELYRYARFSSGHNRTVYRVLLGLEKLSCRVADHVIVTNESYRDLAVRRSEVPRERVTVVRNGPELRTPYRSPTPHAGIDKLTIGYLGIMGFQDGVDLLLQAVASLKRDGQEGFHVLLVGRGDASGDLEALAQSLGIGDVVTFAGWVEADKLPAYLEAFDICVAPEPANGYTELCTMIKIMEYMAYAKPVVAFDLLEHRRTTGDAALYADTGNPEVLAERIRELLNDPDLRSELGRLGRRRVESELAWEYQERALLAAYATLGARRRDGRAPVASDLRG